MVIAPDGTTATFDRALTRAMYERIDEIADCSCAHCRNYRAAWTAEYIDAGLLEACEIIGIDPKKSLEMSYLGAGSVTNSTLYLGTYPFVGTLGPEREIRSGYHPWVFTDQLRGTARVAESGLAAINFFVEVPWILTDVER